MVLINPANAERVVWCRARWANGGIVLPFSSREPVTVFTGLIVHFWCLSFIHEFSMIATEEPCEPSVSLHVQDVGIKGLLWA